MTIRPSSIASCLAALLLTSMPLCNAVAQPAAPPAGAVDPAPPPDAPPDPGRGARDAGPGAPGPRDDRGGPGARAPGGPDSRPNQLAVIHQALADSDEEFAAIEPKIEAVLDDLAATQSATGTLFARGPRGPRGGPADRGARDDRGGPPGPPPDTLRNQF